jgi:hypothetical protein
MYLLCYVTNWLKLCKVLGLVYKQEHADNYDESILSIKLCVQSKELFVFDVYETVIH